jgi:hypothetical protein
MIKSSRKLFLPGVDWGQLKLSAGQRETRGKILAEHLLNSFRHYLQ